MNEAPLSIAIVGLGFGLSFMREVVAGPDARYLKVVAVVDPDDARRAAGAAAFGCAGYRDVDELNAADDAPRVEAVTLFTGPNGRAALIRRLMDAGLHVMTTKPFEIDPDAALAVLHEARARGRVVHLNSPATVEGDDIAQVKVWQRDHGLGRAVFVQSDCWYRSVQDADGTWYDDPKRCPVAPIFRLGVYGINDTLALLERPVSVQVLATRMLTGRPTPDIAQLSIAFACGAVSCQRATWCAGPTRNVLEAEFVFEHGVVRRTYNHPDHNQADGVTLTLQRVDAAGEIHTDAADVPLARSNSSYRWDLFHHAVRGGTVESQVPPERVAAGLRVIAAMTRAHDTGQTVQLQDP